VNALEKLRNEKARPVNKDAGRVIRSLKPDEKYSGFGTIDFHEIQWRGLISKCPYCGGRCYLHGNCFKCGRSIGDTEGIEF
jgi:hypothetical protein